MLTPLHLRQRQAPRVLVHGLNDSHQTWQHLAPALARRRRVLMPDLAGHGLSSRPDASYAVFFRLLQEEAKCRLRTAPQGSEQDARRVRPTATQDDVSPWILFGPQLKGEPIWVS